VDAAAGGGSSASVVDVTLGEDCSAGDWLYLKTSDGKWYKTDATATASIYKPVRAEESGSADGTISAAFDGIVNISGVVEGTDYYLQDKLTSFDSYSETNKDTGKTVGTTGNYLEAGQVFINSVGTSTLDSVKFHMRVNGVLSGNMYAKVYDTTGTAGTNAIPTGAALATSDGVAASVLNTVYTLIEFSFSSPAIVNKGGSYAITLLYEGDAALLVGSDSTTPTHDGNSVQKTGGGWAADSQDVIFYADSDGIFGTIGTSAGSNSKKVGTGWMTDYLLMTRVEAD
jgi:hypothetical protein